MGTGGKAFVLFVGFQFVRAFELSPWKFAERGMAKKWRLFALGSFVWSWGRAFRPVISMRKYELTPIAGKNQLSLGQAKPVERKQSLEICQMAQTEVV